MKKLQNTLNKYIINRRLKWRLKTRIKYTYRGMQKSLYMLKY